MFGRVLELSKAGRVKDFFSAFALVFRYTFEPSTPESLNAVGVGDPGEGQGT